VSAFSFDDIKEFPYPDNENEYTPEEAVDAGQVFKQESVDNEE
jgi:hypothetical protein